LDRVGVEGYEGAGELADKSPSSSVSRPVSSSYSCAASPGERGAERSGWIDVEGRRVSVFERSRNVGLIVDKRNRRDKRK
jgi:hypothetical protein